MTFDPRGISEPDPVFVGTYGPNSMGPHYHATRQSSPASGAYVGVARVHYTPFFVSRPYSLARWWWQNGATVGTDYVQAGIYDEDLNLFAASPRTLSAGTANYLQYANPGVAAKVVVGSASSTDAASYAMASATYKAGRLYLLSVENSAASAGAVSSITGGGPTFVSRSTTQFNTTANRISVWSAVPTVDFTGVLTIDFGGATQTGAAWVLGEFTHVDTTTDHGVVQSAVGTGNSTTPLATLAAFGSANNATYGAFGVANNSPGVPESASYLELSDQVAATPAQGCQAVYRPDNDTTVTETITSGQWGACGLEIKSLGTGAILVPPMRGYLALWCSGTTATFFRNSAIIPMRPYQYAQNSVSTGLGQTATLAAGAGTVYNYGFTSRATV